MPSSLFSALICTDESHREMLRMVETEHQKSEEKYFQTIEETIDALLTVLS